MRTLPLEILPPAESLAPPVHLEMALRRAVFWARRGMPNAAPILLAGTEGCLKFRPDHKDLAAALPAGEVRVQLSPMRRRITITRTEAAYELAGSADLPPHLVECVE